MAMRGYLQAWRLTMRGIAAMARDDHMGPSQASEKSTVVCIYIYISFFNLF